MIEIHNVTCITFDVDGQATITVASPEGKTTDIYIRPECVITITKDNVHGYLHVIVE